jgi:hypothetical protein
VIGWRSQQLPRDFGLRFSGLRATALTAATALPVAAAIGWGLQVAHERTPFDLSHFPLALLLLYFELAAPIQEESIFRGLIQSAFPKFGSGDCGAFNIQFVANSVQLRSRPRSLRPCAMTAMTYGGRSSKILGERVVISWSQQKGYSLVQTARPTLDTKSLGRQSADFLAKVRHRKGNR